MRTGLRIRTHDKSLPQSGADDKKPDGSVMIIVATDAPVNERQLKRLAKRAAIGLGRTGTHIHNGSGDIIIAFSNGFTIPHTSEQMTMAIRVITRRSSNDE